MKDLKNRNKRPIPHTHTPADLAIQAPLPDFLHTLPKLTWVAGRGAVSGATVPPPPPKEAPNDR